MLQKLLIASTNQGKIAEIQKIFSDLNIKIVTPTDVGIDPNFDVEETGTTFKANATLKAKAFAKLSHLSTLADDSGLVVDALDGRPGVYSHRYGPTDQARNHKLLSELKNVPSSRRTARFVAAIVIYDPNTNKTLTAQGLVEGTIADSSKGSDGFGYDPIFIPTEGDGRTFAEFTAEEKNAISHRARALQQIKTLLQQSA